MKFNDSALRETLKKGMQGDGFQKKLSDAYVISEKKLSERNGYRYWSLSKIEAEIRYLKKEILSASINLVTREFSGSSRLRTADPEALLLHTIKDIKLYNNDPDTIVSCKVELYFNPEFVRSASLYPQKYPDGVDNIIKLLTNGWDYRHKYSNKYFSQPRDPISYTNVYRGRMHGDWHLGGPNSKRVVRNVYAVSYRRSNPILFNCIDKYNRGKRDKSAVAALAPSYVGAYGIGGMTNSYNKSGNSQIDSITITGIGIINFGSKH